ncbi:MAG: hypothetical protein IK152_05145 [Lachnospiraceae bacterium]|nr:hypothetical protein [Lachnospiraceae bacterium]
MVINTNVDSNKTKEDFIKAVKGKHIPILTLDQKWHELFKFTPKSAEIKEIEEKLNELLKRQGFINNELKGLKKVKSDLMNEIVENMNESEGEASAKQAKNQELIKEINDKVDAYNDELLDIPALIKEANDELMIATMDIFYHKLFDNSKVIIEISEWIRKIRVELKNKIVSKKAKEIENQIAYTYMHNVFGHEVIDIFDLKYIGDEKSKELKDETVPQENITK